MTGTTISPLMMPTRKVNHAQSVRPVYSTTTGQAPRDLYVDNGIVEVSQPDLDDFDAYDPYCFVCHRCTDHVGEHEALVEAGLAAYDHDGCVRRTEKWDDALAKKIADAEYRDYCTRLGLDDPLTEEI